MHRLSLLRGCAVALLVAGAGAGALVPRSVQAAIITVTSTLDDGAVLNLAGNGSCELREAIYNANFDSVRPGSGAGDCPAGSGTDTIAFDIPGAGPHIIHVVATLPDLFTPIQINGYTQPGAMPNTLAAGTNADIRIGIDGGASLNFGLSFVTGANGSSVRGLRITGFTSSSVLLNGTGGLASVTIAGNFIGTDGNNVVAPGPTGIYAWNGVVDSFIGTGAPAGRNLIAGQTQQGVLLDYGTVGFFIQNNLIGTAADGNTPLSNGGSGMRLRGASQTFVIDNVIGGETYGVYIDGGPANHNILRNNAIGVGADGSSDIGGFYSGVLIAANDVGAPAMTAIGGLGPWGNHIAHWGGDGIRVDRFESAPFSTGNYILGNRIHDNGGLAINLRDAFGGTGDGVDANDVGDADNGANALQNFPVIQSASSDGANTSIAWSLNTTPAGGEGYHVEFFASPTCDASGHGEAENFLGSFATTTAADGASTQSGPTILAGAVPIGHFITMTATRDSTGDTSELSACMAVTAPVAQTPPVLGDIPDQTTTTGAAFSLGVGGYVIATNGDPVSYAITVGALPPGLLFDAASGTISGVPTMAGVYAVTVVASDDDGASNADSFAITVQEVAAPSPTTVQPVPVMSPFGLAFLSSMLGGLGVLRRRRGR